MDSTAFKQNAAPSPSRPTPATSPSSAACRRRLSPKQETIVNQIEIMGSITLSSAVNILGRRNFYNAEKRVGALLSNMVKRGLIARLRPGVFGRVTKTTVGVFEGRACK